MDGKSVIWVVIALIFGIGGGLVLAQGQTKEFTFAVVDVPKVVAASSKVNALKAEEAIKVQELQNFIQKAQKEADEEKDEEKKRELLQQYEKEILIKKQEIEQDYAQKLAQIDAEITKIITDEAERNKINVVVAKSNVIYGGVNITEAVVNLVK